MRRLRSEDCGPGMRRGDFGIWEKRLTAASSKSSARVAFVAASPKMKMTRPGGRGGAGVLA